MYRQQSLLTTLLFLSFVTSNHKFQFVFLTHNYSTLSTIYYVPPNILMYNVPSTVYFDYVPCTMFNYYLRYITATQKKKFCASDRTYISLGFRGRWIWIRGRFELIRSGSRSFEGQIERKRLKNLKIFSEVYFITTNYHEFFSGFMCHFLPQKNL